MGFLKILKGKSEDLFRKYKVSDKIDKITTNENIRIIGWIFIFSRFYRTYQLVIIE